MNKVRWLLTKMGESIIYNGKKANKKRNIPDEQHTPNKKAEAKAGS